MGLPVLPFCAILSLLTSSAAFRQSARKRLLAHTHDDEDDWYWVFGPPGSSCASTCASTGFVCDAARQSEVTSHELLAEKVQELLGVDCAGEGEESRSYAGAPFYRDAAKDCYHLTPGTTSVCNENVNAGHRALCYCRKADDTPKWVALGDSYASGLGIHTAHTDYQDCEAFGCCRDWHNVPGAKYAREHGMPFLNKACAFTYMGWVPLRPLVELASEYRLDTLNKWEGSIFSVTTGGNDLTTVRGETWEVLLMRCILTPSNCSTDPENEVSNIDDVETRLTGVLSEVAAFASAAKIRVTGYPRLMTFGSWCFAVPGMTGTDAAWIDSMVDLLNGRISSATSAAKRANPEVDILFVPVEDYVTRGACSWSNRQINGVVLSLPEGVSYATLHPQQSGYDAVLEALTASLQ